MSPLGVTSHLTHKRITCSLSRTYTHMLYTSTYTSRIAHPNKENIMPFDMIWEFSSFYNKNVMYVVISSLCSSFKLKKIKTEYDISHLHHKYREEFVLVKKTVQKNAKL